MLEHPELDEAARAAARLESWRLGQFLEMDADVPTAERLAASEVDLHEFKKLRDRGCTAELAARILI